MSTFPWLVILGSFVLAAVVAWALCRAAALKLIQLSHSTTARVERARAYDFIRHQAYFPTWSPFLEEDPTQTYLLLGQDGQVGGQYHWIGRKGKDVGLQEIVALEANRRIDMQCRIEKPFRARPTFSYTLDDAPGGGVVVTQIFELQSGFINAFFLWLFGVKKQMTVTNRKGMESLRRALETSR